MLKFLEKIADNTPNLIKWLLAIFIPICLLIRVSAPHYVENSRTILDKITAFSGRPVIAEHVTYRWKGWSPEITISGLKLLDDEKKKVLLYFPKLTTTISLVESIATGSLVSKKIHFTGMDIEILQAANGKFRIVGMPTPKFPIFKWLLQQRKVELSKSNILLTFEERKKSVAMRKISAVSINSKSSQTIIGEMAFEQGYAQQGAFSLVTDKSVTEAPDKIDCNFVLKSANPTALLSEFTEYRPAQALPVLDIEGWSTWRNSELKVLDFYFSESTNIGAKTIPDIRGRANHVDLGWFVNFTASSSTAGTKKKLGQVATILLENRSNKPKLITKARNVDLEAAFKLRQLFSPTKMKGSQPLLHNSLKGKLKSILLVNEFADDGTNKFFGRSKFTGLSSKGNDNIPPFSGLSGDAEIFSGGMDLVFTDSDLKIARHQTLYTPLTFTKFSGSLIWRSAGKLEKSAVFKRFSGTVNGIAFDLNGHTNIQNDGQWSIDAIMDITNAPAANLHHLIQVKRLPQKNDAWTRNAFMEGTVENGSMIIRGPINKFPFRKMEGMFSADLQVTEATILFSKLWPPLEHAKGEIKMRGLGTNFKVSAATIKSLNISDATISSSNLYTKERYARFKGTIITTDGVPEEFVKESPLKDTGASQLVEFVITNPIKLALDMKIPLFFGGEKYIAAKVYLERNDIKNKNIDLTFKSTSGTLNYTNGKWHGTDLTAMLDNSEVSLDVRGGLKSPPFNTELVVSGNSSTAEIFNRLRRHAPKFSAWLKDYNVPTRFNGVTAWKSVLRLPDKQTENRIGSAQITVSTDLIGINITLPKPFQKTAVDSKSLVVDLILQNGKVSKTAVTYGGIFKSGTHYLLAKKHHSANEPSPTTRALDVDRNTSRILHINTSADYVPASAWLSFVTQNKNSAKREATLPSAIFELEAKKMTFLGHQFNSAKVHMSRPNGSYLLNLSGSDAEGSISIPTSDSKNEINVSLARLRLIPKVATEGTIDKISLSSIPSATIKIEEFMYHGIEFGTADIKIEKSEGKINFSRLNFQSVDATILSQGTWEYDGLAHYSTLNFSMSGSKASKAMQQFGYRGNNIKDGKTEINAALEWPNTPELFDLKYVTGNLDLKITNGRFKDIDPGAGRIFGLLSIQSLPRRLSLDFKDLFRKGFSFDVIEGSFALKESNAYTDAFIMSGPSAKIEISGRTGLIAKDYDQNAIVTPALSNSIPVASALFGPVGIGAGAVYYIGQKVFKTLPDRVDNFLKQEYSIKGSWADPKIERL